MQSQLFNSDTEKKFGYIETIVSELAHVSYEYMPIDEYEKLMRKDIVKANRIYWYEILLRAQFAATNSLLRNLKWFKGVKTSYLSKNYLSFCANIRALIESAADSSYSLSAIPKTLAKNSHKILLAFKNEMEIPHLSEELEKLLIHYSHARKINKSEEADESHYAKTTTEYLKQYLEFSELTIECYRELCQITHPAIDSVFYFYSSEDGFSFKYDPKADETSLELFIYRYSETFDKIFVLAFNAALLSLKVIQEMNIPEFHYTIIDRLMMDKVKAWRELKDLMSKDET